MATAPADVQLLLKHIAAAGLTPTETARGWPHIGAIICDAALQRQAVYTTHVKPRVMRLIEQWPDADTLSGFTARTRRENISSVLNWRGPQKLAVIDGLTTVFSAAGIETVANLAGLLADDNRAPEFRRALRTVPNVGPKTVDYIAVLAGSAEHVPVDMHIKGFARQAGINYHQNYTRVADLITATAREGGWSTGALDAAIWQYMSTRTAAPSNGDRPS